VSTGPFLAALVAVVAAVIGTALGSPAAGLFIGAAVAALGGAVQRRAAAREVAQLAAQVRGWESGAAGPVRMPADPALADLAVALDAAGDAFTRRLQTIVEELPWRRQLVESLPTATILFDADGYVAAGNRAARELLGIPSDGEPTTILAALGSARLAAAVRGMHAGDEPVEVDAMVSGRTVRALVTVIGDQRLVLVTDRTQELRLENVRRNFVVNASHELKTPTTSIQALAEALLITVERDPDRLPDLLRRLEQESGRLVRLVHDLLDLRRLEDRGEVAPTAVDLVPVVADALGDLPGSGPQVVTRLTGLERAMVLCDPDDLRIIVRNLVANGAQYNQDGGSLDVTIEPRDGSVAMVVADTGIGIPKDDLGRIFERFYRVDVARSRLTGGTGLGLALVRHAIGRNHGVLDVESLLGSGSTFTVVLPAARAVPAPRRDRDDVSLAAVDGPGAGWRAVGGGDDVDVTSASGE